MKAKNHKAAIIQNSLPEEKKTLKHLKTFLSLLYLIMKNFTQKSKVVN